MRLRTMTAGFFVALVAAGCASTTDGSGSVGAPASSGASSSPDFPSSSATPTGPSGSSSAAGSTGSSSNSGSHPVPDQPLRTITVSTDGRTYVVQIWADVSDKTCFDHAYGQAVVAFLTQHPCTGLRRYLATTTVGGRAVGFAESQTGFRGTAKDPYANAAAFIKLEERDGTGSLNDLMREGYRLPEGPTSVPDGEAFRVLGQDQGVTVWDAWYLQGTTPTNATPLMTMAQDLFLRF